MLATANGHDMIVDLFTNKYEADIDIMSFVRGLFIVLYTLFAGLRYFVTRMFVVALFVFFIFIYSLQSRSNALHYGAANGHLHPCKTLIDAGINPNVKDMVWLSCLFFIFRSSCSQMFFIRGVLKNFAIFTEKLPVLETLFDKKRLWYRCFLVSFAKFSRTSFFRTPLMPAFDYVVSK